MGKLAVAFLASTALVLPAVAQNQFTTLPIPTSPISQLQAAGTLTGPELFYVVQGGVSKNVTYSSLSNFPSLTVSGLAAVNTLTVAGLATAKNLAVSGAPGITQSWSGASNLVTLNSNVVSASATLNEVASIIQMTSNLGAGTSYKGAFGTQMTMNAGSGQGFAINAVLTVNTGVGAQQANAFEPDFNNFNEDYPLPNQSGYLGFTGNAIDIAFGSNGSGSFAGSAALYMGTLNSGPNYSWHAGIYMLGPTLIKDYTIFDGTDSASSYYDNGTHVTGINLAAAVYSGNAYQSTGAAISATGFANFNELIVPTLAGTGSRPVCVTSAGLFGVGSLSSGLVTCP